VSLIVGISAPALGLLVGGALGIVAGYFRGRFEKLTMGAMDVLLAFPPLVLALAIIAYMGQTLLNLTLVLALLSVPASTRVARAATLAISQREFVLAARALGATGPRIVWRHLLPGVLAPVIVAATLGVGGAIMAEAALSFVGLGARPPAPSWGAMVADGRDLLRVAPWVSIVPGLAIGLTVLGVNLVGDGLRDALEVRPA
jgi:peptide/nickel transport system permease protein